MCRYGQTRSGYHKAPVSVSSTLGVVSVGALLVTGSVNGFFLIGDARGLTKTEYGRMLLIKIALFAVMVAIAVNRLALTPLLAAPDGRRRTAKQRLVRNSLIEVCCGLAILAMVSVLGMLPPPGHDPHAAHWQASAE
jgi:putative copper resistance protein D